MHQEFRKAIGERLRRARIAAKLTQQDVATDFLRSRQAISSWESGRTMPDLLELRELAMLYGVTPDRILIGADDLERQCERALARMRGVIPSAPSTASPSLASELPPGHPECPSEQ